MNANVQVQAWNPLLVLFFPSIYKPDLYYSSLRISAKSKKIVFFKKDADDSMPHTKVDSRRQGEDSPPPHKAYVFDDQWKYDLSVWGWGVD